MSVQSKDVDSFWLQRIKYPFSAGRLPWGTGKRNPRWIRVGVPRDMPDDTLSMLRQFCGDNEDTMRIVYIAVLKLVLYNYLGEKNIYIMGFDRQGPYLFTTPVEGDSDLRRLLLSVRDDFDEMSAVGTIDPGNMIDKYRIRLGHKSEEEFYKFALVYPDLQESETQGPYDLVCRIADKGDGLSVTVSYWSDAAYAPGFLDLLADNFVYACGKVREWSDQPVATIDIRCPRDRQISGSCPDQTKGPLDETGREVPVGVVGKMGGDRVRRRPDGGIEYLGRLDNFIKLGGFPIQTEEVENRIRETGKVKDVVVMSGLQKEGECLCAYFEAEEKVDTVKLQEELLLYLPHYMVPSHFMQLARIPVTQSGEKDIRSLAEMTGVPNRSDSRPKTQREQILEGIWKEIFGLPAVGIADGFYELGGDSIKAIQIRSKLAARGFTLSIREILELNFLEAMAMAMKEEKAEVAEQAKSWGETALTPIQLEFLMENWPSRDHLNQSLLLDIAEDPGEETIREIFEKIIDHHDTLRLRISESEQTFLGIIEKEVPTPVVYHDLRGRPSADLFMEEETLRVQRGLHVSQAPMMGVVLFGMDSGTKLLIVLHHLLTDGVSWRVLMEDFKTLYDQKRQGRPFTLPLKTQSLKKWNELILDKVVPRALKELDHWTDTCRKSQDLFRLSGEKNYARDFSTMRFLLGREVGQALNGAARIADTSTTEELLLAAFCMALEEIYGCSRVLMSLERHGRDACGAQADVGRTIGWFTSVFPVLIEWPVNAEMRKFILAVRESLRVTPEGGARYGILRYLIADGRKIAHPLAWLPDVEFNYLGELSNHAGSDLFTVVSYSPGEQAGADHLHRAPLIVNAFLTEDHSVDISLLYNTRFLAEKDVRQLALSYRKYLEEVSRPGDSWQQLSQLSRYEIEDIYPLTPLQEGILFHLLVSGDPTVYSEQVFYHYTGELQHEVLFGSLDILSRRHQLLRAAYVHGGTERPVQVILKDARIKRKYENIGHLTTTAQEQHVLKIKQADKRLGFRPEEGPLLRLHLIRLSARQYCFLWSFHHLIMDGWSLDVVNQELFTIYSSLIGKSKVDLMPAPNFKSFIEWLGSKDKAGDRHYWTGYLAGFQAGILIPGAMAAGGEEKAMVIRTGDLAEIHVNGLRRIASSRHVTVNGLIQVAWAVLLGRYNHTDDVTFGLIVAGRPSEIPDVERMVGMFINAIPRRISLGGTRDIITLARKVQEDAVDSLKHSHYPLAELQRDLGIRGELFDSILNYINYPPADRVKIRKEEGTDLLLPIGDIEVFERTHYDFTVSVIDYAGITVKFEYIQHRYDGYVMEQLFGSFLYLIRQIAEGISDVGQLQVIGSDQKHKLIMEAGGTELELGGHGTIQQLFEAQAAGTPDAVALISGQTRLDYKMLNEEANRLASYLRENYMIRAGDLVAVRLDRSERLITTLLGILKSGAAYVPLDIGYPEERVDFIVKDTQSKVLIDEGWYSAFVAERGSCDGNNPVSGAGPHDLAYVIYTSGSTGNPKGVMIEHSSVINLVLAQRREFGITADENILLASHISFDASVEQIFIALTSGARLTIIDRETLLDAERFERLIDDGGITHIHLVPGLLKMLTARKYSRLKRVIAGGDKCPKELADSWAGYYTFYNEYGPTETTVTALEWRYDPAADLSFVPIGRPVANTRVYILDGVSLSPVGAVGEICIGGAGVARGYLNRETLTQDKFISNPFLEGDRIYRTGDLGRWTEGGVIEFLGRMDHQVKVRGFRVEPGEIENRLLQYGKFTEACVCVYAGEGKEGQEKLVAYLVAQELPFDIPAIKEYLGRSLPAYMVPSLYIQLQQLPLTPIGKVDRAALPAPEGAVPAASGISGEGSEEANGTRKRLIGIWEEVLGIRHPGTAVNFFDLGATSIDLMVASGKMKKYFNVDDLLVKIFHYPSIDLLAGYIDRVLDGREREGMAGEIIDRANVRNRRQRRRNLNS